MGSRMVRGVGAAAGGVVQFLNKVVDVSVVVPLFVFKVFSQDGFSSVL